MSNEKTFVNNLFGTIGLPQDQYASIKEDSKSENEETVVNVDKENEEIDPIKWIESEFYIPELMAPLVLYPYQKAALREAYRTDSEGNYLYSLVIWGDIKKSAKSTIAAAVALERARRTPYGSFRIAANSKDQADSRVSYYLRRAISLNPRLNQTVRTKLYNVLLPNHCFIQSVPLNPKTVAGGNDDMVSFSELWAADNNLAQECWTELTLSPTKYGKSQRWVDTYAGYHDVSILLERLYLQGREGYLVETDIPGLELYANPETQILMLWNTQPRLPWQTTKYYAQEAGVLTETEFNRIHRNQWASSVSEFVPEAWWTGCIQPVPEPKKFDCIAIGVDAAVKGDCFAIVGVSKHGDLIVPRFVKIWTPPKHGKINFNNKDNPYDENYPQGYLRTLIRDNNVVIVGYDPYQLHSMMTELENENLSWFYEFGQVKERLEADKQLYDFIAHRKVANPENSDLTNHILNADAEMQGEKHLRIVKRSESSKVDAAVAFSMATYLAVENIPD
jgi:hypothetical protein